MKKLSQAADLGFAPFFKSDLAGIFNKEIWDAIEALLYPYNADVQGIVVSGCVTTNNAGNFDMTAGVVYLNGEFMKVAAVTNQTFTKYIAPSSPINDTRTFLDTTSHVVTIDKQAGLVGSIPGSGQYLAISSLTDLDDRRWKPAFFQDIVIESNNRIAADLLKVNKSGDTITGTLEVDGGIRTLNSGPFTKNKIIDIGSWNMPSTANKQVAHGLSFADYSNIIGIKVVIYIDDYSVGSGSTIASGSGLGGGIFDLCRPNCGTTASNTIDGGIDGISPTYVNLFKNTVGTIFNNAVFSNTSNNRGKVIIEMIA